MFFVVVVVVVVCFFFPGIYPSPLLFSVTGAVRLPVWGLLAGISGLPATGGLPALRGTQLPYAMLLLISNSSCSSSLLLAWSNHNNMMQWALFTRALFISFWIYPKCQLGMAELKQNSDVILLQITIWSVTAWSMISVVRQCLTYWSCFGGSSGTNSWDGGQYRSCTTGLGNLNCLSCIGSRPLFQMPCSCAVDCLFLHAYFSSMVSVYEVCCSMFSALLSNLSHATVYCVQELWFFCLTLR